MQQLYANFTDLKLVLKSHTLVNSNRHEHSGTAVDRRETADHLQDQSH